MNEKQTLEYYRAHDSNLVKHALSELDRIGWDDMQTQMNLHLLGMVEMFSEEGHSGFSASYALNLLKKLLNFEPIGALTGEDDEWVEVGTGTSQNKRMGSVFKENGAAYYLYGKAFSDDDGKTWYTSGESRIPVEFPWIKPETERILVECQQSENETATGC